MSESFDVVILGAGAAGLMCAAQLTEHAPHLSVALIEGNSRPALKLKASGGGKCNLTNVEVDESHFLGDGELVSYALASFTKENLLDYFKKGGLKPVIRKERYYFCPHSSEEVISILVGRSQGCRMFLNEQIVSVEGNDRFTIRTEKRVLSAKHVVVATGGPSYKTIGATDIGLKIAQEYRIDTLPFAPVLVGLTVQSKEFWMKELSGISFKARIHIAGKILEEDILFAHKGISGPVVLSASLYWFKGEMIIDFLPDVRLENVYKEKKIISTAIPLPKRFMKAFLGAVGLEDKPCNILSAEEKEKLALLRAYSMAPAGTFGLTKAEACRGGIACEELEPWSMQCKKIKNLYFIGETVDVTGELGGYNFQWAFSSAVVCARAIGEF